MNIAVQLEFKADRKEPLGELIRRVAALFEQNGLQADVVATFSDGPGGIRNTSAVERALKKYPRLGRFERNDAPPQAPGLPPIRRLTNAGASSPFPMTDVLALADGVPRSLPFHAVSVHFGHADFGRATFPIGLAPPTGIAISDGWWVNGRIRGLTAFYAVEGDPGSKNLSDPSPAIAAIFASLGKPKRKAQFIAPAAPATAGSLPPEVARVKAIIAKYHIVAVETSRNAIDLYDWTPAWPVCLVFGHEKDGVTESLAAQIETQVRIPMFGEKRSLNVATAAGVVLYDLLRRRR